MTGIETNGLPEIERRLLELSTGRFLRRAITISVLDMQNKLAVYPPKPRQGFGFVSDKQRRWFFANLREGKIEVPYKHTGKLGQSWTTRVEVADRQVVGIVGNNRVYAPWVQSSEEVGGVGPQARIHEGRWPVAQDILEREQDRIRDRIINEIRRVIGDG